MTMLEPDEIAVNLMRRAGLDKHKARECEALVLEILRVNRALASPQAAPQEAAPSDWPGFPRVLTDADLADAGLLSELDDVAAPQPTEGQASRPLAELTGEQEQFWVLGWNDCAGAVERTIGRAVVDKVKCRALLSASPSQAASVVQPSEGINNYPEFPDSNLMDARAAQTPSEPSPAADEEEPVFHLRSYGDVSRAELERLSQSAAPASDSGRIEELEALLRQAKDALDEATTYTSSESWSPSMTRDCEKVIADIDAALKNQEQSA
jgi:hypothetical protein